MIWYCLYCIIGILIATKWYESKNPPFFQHAKLRGTDIGYILFWIIVCWPVIVIYVYFKK